MGFFETFLNFEVMRDASPLLLAGLVTTLLLASTSIVAGTVFGAFMALLKLYGPKSGRILSMTFIDVFRAIPVLVILILVYYALPFAGIRFSPFVSAWLALTLVLTAYAAEVFRAGLQAIPEGQFEASYALGLPWFVMMRKVIFPQAFKLVVPPSTNNAVSILKDTSLASVVAMPDLLKQATDAQALNANPSPLIAAALMYLAILWPAVRLVAYLENRSRN